MINPTIVSGLLLVLSFLATPFFFRKIWLNPLVIFFGVWFLNFIVYELDHFFNFYYIDLSPKTEFLFMLSFVGFFIGSMSVAIYKALPKKIIPSIILPHKDYSYLAFLEKISIFLFILVLVSVLGKYILLMLHYGNPLAHLGEIRVSNVSGDFTYPKILQLFSIFRYVLVVNLAVLCFFSSRKKYYIILTAITVILSVFTDVAVAGRGGILNTFLFLIGALLAGYLAKGIKLKAKNYFDILALIFILFSLFASILYLRGHDNNFLKKFVSNSYYYFTGTIPAVESFVQNPLESPFFGYNTFSGLYQGIDKLTGIAGVNFLSGQDYQTSYAPISHIGPFNSAGHLAYYYSDFRELGVLIMPYLLGLWSTWLFFLAYERPRILTIQMCAIATAFIFITIRGTMTAGASIWFTIFAILIQYIFFEWKGGLTKYPRSLVIGNKKL